MPATTRTRRRIAVALVLLAIAAWAAAGLRRVPADDHARVAYFPAVGWQARVLRPGWRWLPAGLARTTRIPREAELTLRGDAGPPIVSREGARFDLAGGEVAVIMEPLGALEVLGPRWEDALRGRIHEAARAAVADGRADDPSRVGLAALGRLVESDLAA